jgi:hypothetical protein
MRVAIGSGMRNDFVFVVQSFKRARGSEFQKMHVEFYVNVLSPACSAQELDEATKFPSSSKYFELKAFTKTEVV